MAKFCVYCGNPVKSNDKFCIKCGKPMLSNLPKADKKTKMLAVESKSKEILEKIKKKKKEKEEVKPQEGIKEESEEEKLEEKEDSKKEEEIIEPEKKEKEKIEKEIKPLPEEVKEQIEYFLELNDIKLKKLSLADKLKDFQKLMKSDRYDTDFAFGEKINMQLKAVKTLIEELKEEENEVKLKMDDQFIIEKLDADIGQKKDHLKNLMREHKLKKIKDKDVVKKLREKYKQQLEDSTTEKDELIDGLDLWVEEIEGKIAEITIDRKFNKGRYSAKEISPEEFKTNDNEFDKQISKLKSKVKTLQNLAK
jgi:hypothetical protein